MCWCVKMTNSQHTKREIKKTLGYDRVEEDKVKTTKKRHIRTKREGVGGNESDREVNRQRQMKYCK